MTDIFSGKQPSNRRLLWLLLGGVGIAVFGLILYLVQAFPETLEDGGARLGFTYKITLLAVLAAAAAVRWKTRPGVVLSHAAIWVAIAAVIFLGYAFKDEASQLGRRLMAELLPHKGQVGPENRDSISYRAQVGGHFIVEAMVDGEAVQFMVDTGASDVMLRPTDAKRLGFDLKTLRYDKVYNTANGSVRGASVRLRQIALGPIVLNDVPASVNGAAMGRSLLGMSFLSRLSSYQVKGDRLILTK